MIVNGVQIVDFCDVRYFRCIWCDQNDIVVFYYMVEEKMICLFRLWCVWQNGIEDVVFGYLQCLVLRKQFDFDIQILNFCNVFQFVDVVVFDFIIISGVSVGW